MVVCWPAGKLGHWTMLVCLWMELDGILYKALYNTLSISSRMIVATWPVGSSGSMNYLDDWDSLDDHKGGGGYKK